MRVKQILINLIINAADAIHELQPEAGGGIQLVIDGNAERVTISVKDNGIGTSEATTRDTFEAFKTTKQLRGGQGLGLWLCARFAERMQGKLSLHSAGPGLGATAALELRATEPQEQQDDINIDDYLMDPDSLRF